MGKYNQIIDIVDRIITDGVARGLGHLTAEDTTLSGNQLCLKGNKVVNFGSCSYLGLEFDRRMVRGAQRALLEYGTQFSASRAYVSPVYYDTLENELTQLFGSPTIAAPTTTLGHISTIPVIIYDDDAIILDHQAHNSTQTAVNLVKPRGVHVEMIRHNNMDMLESRVQKLREKHKRIWYMADGIYSMFGDNSPVGEVYELMERYPELYYYVDDAHGMSCYGEHGRGYVLSESHMHERMVLITSLNKAYASGGAALVFPNAELARKVRTCGGPFLSSGPMQPAALGAAIASAAIHLSPEIYQLQEELQENIRYTNLMLRKHGLPIVAENDSPVFFVGVGLPKMGYNMIGRMLKDGYYLNLGIFPTVPMKNTGLRFTITRLHTFEQIDNMVAAMAHHYPRALDAEGFSLDKVYRAFKMHSPEDIKADETIASLIGQSELAMQHVNTITAIDREEWDSLLGDRGAFEWEGLKFLENAFKNNPLPEDNWEFDFIIIRDLTGKPVLATFLTTALAKDDMLALSEVSKQIELKRIDAPYYLTSKLLSTGSLLTEGDHIYLDKSSPLWKDALHILLEKIDALQEKYKATVINLRDFDREDPELFELLMTNGYFRTSMPDNHIIEAMDWADADDYLKSLSKKSRRHIREFVLRHYDKYDVEKITDPSKAQVKRWYEMYKNVKNNSYAINTFDLPFRVFSEMSKSKSWDILELRLKPQYTHDGKSATAAVMFSYIAKSTYNPMILGLDYAFQDEFKCYRQALYRVIMRAKELNLNKVRLGFSASIEKRKVGARVVASSAFMQVQDHYNMEVLGAMSAAKKVQPI